MSNFSNRALAALTLTLAACGAHEPAAAPDRVTATMVTVQRSAVPESRITTGTVRSSTVSPLSAKVMGNVTRVFVSEGDRVRRGQPLVEIDARDIRAKVAQAEAGSQSVEDAIAAARANADLASATLRRFTVLKDRGSVSAQEFDEVAARAAAAKAELQRAEKMRDQARAGVDEAETVLGFDTVRSPIDGIVTARMIDPGAQAAPGMALVTVEDPANRRVETTVDEALARQIRVGDAANVATGFSPSGDGLKPVTTSGRVANIAAVDPSTRSALVKIALPQDSTLSSGSFVHVRFVTGKRDALTIPASSIASRGQLSLVYVVDRGGIARMRLITPGETFGDRTEVLSGLDAGEQIVTTPTVREGSLVSGART